MVLTLALNPWVQEIIKSVPRSWDFRDTTLCQT